MIKLLKSKYIVNNIYKYLFFISFSMHKQFMQKKHLLFKIFHYSLIILIYQNIFIKVTNNLNRLWYIGINQWVLGSISIVIFSIQNDILTKRITYYSLKPTYYIFYKYFDAFGESIIKFIIIGLNCIIQIYFITNYFPYSITNFIIGIITMLFSLFLFNSILIFLGLVSFWIKSIKNLLYLNLTSSICFGGLIMPLDRYPDLIKKIAYFTPYPWVLSWPANIMTNNFTDFKIGFLYWTFWFLLFLVLNIFLYNKIQNSDN